MTAGGAYVAFGAPTLHEAHVAWQHAGPVTTNNHETKHKLDEEGCLI